MKMKRITLTNGEVIKDCEMKRDTEFGVFIVIKQKGSLDRYFYPASIYEAQVFPGEMTVKERQLDEEAKEYSREFHFRSQEDAR